MGSVIYNFLIDSIFFHKGSLDNKFKNESEDRIRRELESYRNHCINNYQELILEIKDRNSFLKVFSSTEKTSMDLLKQTSLYVDQFIIFDPLFKQSDFQSDMAKVTGEFLGYKTEQFDKEEIWYAANFMKEITPMIAADFVKAFPLSYHFEAPKTIPINLPVDYYNGILPKPLLEFFWENVEVRSMRKGDKEGWIVDEDKLKLSRGIVVDFKNSDYSSSMIYHLFEMEVLKIDEETGKATIAQTLPDHPPSVDHFNAWVTQSVNSAAKAYFDRVFNESFISANLDSTYLVNNQFSSDLLNKNFQTKESIPSFTATQIMNIDLPFLDNLDTQALMDIRMYQEDVFTNFRLELEKNFRELRDENDPDILKHKAENIFHELNEVQGQVIKSKVEQFKKKMAASVTIGLAGLASSIQTSGLSLLGTAVALGKGYKDFLEFHEKVKSNPAFLLWKAKRKK